ncbi:Pathogen-associated molecular patterns-induced protein A70 [Camellia lanceoleosa]|uniref:Pathogen-associated molecular patterns-induced protein A70 n=1 Tax=Camellia lanceoleosa TaxID=1840588 RepID=A0ACC0GJN5_9ERIC|nr:Pathogen-associated molecular patterns-induced protein A70 [Camellia lanceoleosa]
MKAVEDEQVDAKANNFINRFRQQLKLQRLDFIRRYKHMISRGGAKHSTVVKSLPVALNNVFYAQIILQQFEVLLHHLTEKC